MTIRTLFADGLSPVAGDRVQFQQVVLNLIINGIEAMTSVRDQARELAITTRNIDPDQVQVTVEEPACLVLDLQLPGLSGLDLQKRMAERHGLSGKQLGISRPARRTCTRRTNATNLTRTG